MNDTTPEVDRAFRSLIMSRSASERALMAFEMFDLARTLMTADIRSSQPDITDEELRVQIFKRTYGNDFEPAYCDYVVRRIRASAGGESPGS